jgi:hypothetical protein
VWAVGGLSQPGFTIENQSGQAVRELHVTIAEHEGTFRNMAQGAKVSAPFTVRGGEPFTVKGKFANGDLIGMRGLTQEGSRLVILPGGTIIFRKDGQSSR